MWGLLIYGIAFGFILVLVLI